MEFLMESNLKLMQIQGTLEVSYVPSEYALWTHHVCCLWLICSSFKYAYVLFCWLILECSALLLLSGFKDVGFKLSILTCPSSEACSLLLYCCCYWFLIAALVVAALLVALLSCFSFFLVLVAFDWFLTNLGFSACTCLCFLCGANLVGIVEVSYDAQCTSLLC